MDGEDIFAGDCAKIPGLRKEVSLFSLLISSVRPVQAAGQGEPASGAEALAIQLSPTLLAIR